MSETVWIHESLQWCHRVASPRPCSVRGIAKQFPNQFAVSRLFAKHMNKQLGHVQDAHTSDLYSVNELSTLLTFSNRYLTLLENMRRITLLTFKQLFNVWAWVFPAPFFGFRPLRDADINIINAIGQHYQCRRAGRPPQSDNIINTIGQADHRSRTRRSASSQFPNIITIHRFHLIWSPKTRS